MPERFYLDEDPSEDIGLALIRLGHDVVTTRELGFKGRSDPAQLAFAAREGRILITCNVQDFVMLHEAWVTWSTEWGIEGRRYHRGILIVPNSRDPGPNRIGQLIHERVGRDERLENRLLRWRRTTGWHEPLAYLD